jgi:hypothetical protein
MIGKLNSAGTFDVVWRSINPIKASKGAQILPNDNGDVNAPISIHIDATGADAAGLARVQQQLVSLQRTLPATIVTTVKKAKTNRVL